MNMDGASSVVLQALTQATSQDTAVLKPAEEQLRQWETQPGFYSVLLVIISNVWNKSARVETVLKLFMYQKRDADECVVCDRQ